MKRWLSGVMAALMLFSLTGCGSLAADLTQTETGGKLAVLPVEEPEDAELPEEIPDSAESPPEEAEPSGESPAEAELPAEAEAAPDSQEAEPAPLDENGT